MFRSSSIVSPVPRMVSVPKPKTRPRNDWLTSTLSIFAMLISVVLHQPRLVDHPTVGHGDLSAEPLEPCSDEQQDARHSTQARQDQEHEVLTRGGGVPKRESDP